MNATPKILPLLVALSLPVPSAAAQELAVPAPLQASTIDKMIPYDRAFADRSQIRILIVYQDAARERWAGAVASLQQAFAAVGLRAEPVAASGLAGRLGSQVIAYLLPDAASEEVVRQVATAKALSVSGDAALAEAGRAAVGLALKGDRAEMVVNLDRVQQEGHDLAAPLLKLARVVRGGGGGAAAAGGEGFQAPVLVSLDKPEYPTMARRLRVEGDVVMRLQVDEAGRVTGVELVKGVSRTGGIDEAALAAARTARFKPATRGGVPVASTYTLTMPFRL